MMTTAPHDRPAGPDAAPSQFTRLIRWRDAVALPLRRWFDRFDSVLAGQPAWIGAIAFVLVLQIVLITQHRPWLDEWQALQLAVQSPRVSDLLFNLRYEGHPPLWYLILRAVAALFANPVRALPATALIIAIPVQLTILLAAPFSRAERVMLALSEFVLFEYLTVSRSLTLGIAVMFAIAALWKRPRLAWLLIAILPMCDFLFGVVSVVFAVLRWRERRVYWLFAGLWVISGLFVAWSVRPMPDIASALQPRSMLHEFPIWLANMGTLGLPLQWNGTVPQWNSPPPLPLIGLALAGFFAVASTELRKKPDFAWAFGAFVAVLLVFDLTVYELSIRHLSIAAALLITLVWRMAGDNLPRSVWWRTWLLVISVSGLFTAVVALHTPFDTEEDAAAMIRQMGLADKTWVAFPHSAGQGIAAINGMTIERIAQHCSEDFIRWNAPDEHSIRSINALNIRLRQKVAQDGRFYLVSSFRILDEPPLLHHIGQVSPGYDGKAYYLYVVGQGQPDARPHNQPCSGPHLPLPVSFTR